MRYMTAGELYPKLALLTLCGQNEEGDLEFIGKESQWRAAETLENEIWNRQTILEPSPFANKES